MTTWLMAIGEGWSLKQLRAVVKTAVEQAR